MASSITSQHPIVLLESFSGGAFPRSFRFDRLESVVVARTAEEVLPALRQIEQAAAQGMHAAGFVSYEAAAAINPELSVREGGELPLVWFGIFAERHEALVGGEHGDNVECRLSTPLLEISQEEYSGAICSIREAIARGETYQVNFTTRQRFEVSGDHFALYRRMCRNQRAPFCAWIDTGTHRILSASPELFFSLEKGLLTMKPMKGTAPRMPRCEDDLRRREQLSKSAKERAENLMIVDLVRNDLATIAETGSVAVPKLFEIETYPTLHQMTSTVTARVRPETGLFDIFRALFPCGSVTGAPKRRTMEIIRELEQSPRGPYCGAIGYVSPGGEALFSVAIRTAVLNSCSGHAEFGIGSGITWDSDPEGEYRECLDKSAFLSRDSAEFELIETLRHDRDGYLLLERHLRRLADSAAYFGFRFDADGLAARLMALEPGLEGIHKVRLLLAEDGTVTLEASQLEETQTKAAPIALALAKTRMDPTDPFLYHKTTRRALFEEERRSHPGCGEVIFLNDRGEATEGSYNNIVISLGGELLTPSISCGLLPGVLRAELIEVGAIREAVLTLEDLAAAERIWLINSVRGWREACLSTNP